MYHNCNVIAIKTPGSECIIENKVENARQRVMTNFTWKKTASTILEQL